MNNEIKQSNLLKKIDQKRTEMIYLGQQFGLTSEQTILCSQELDKLLNRYEGVKTNSRSIKVHPRRGKIKKTLYHMLLVRRKATIGEKELKVVNKRG